MAGKKLLNEFPSVSTEQWMERIKEDLRGAEYEKKLVWEALEGIKVQPLFRREDLDKLTHMDLFPGESPYVRGNRVKGNEWQIREEVIASDPSVANREALDSLNRGSHSIGFHLKETDGDLLDYYFVSSLLKDIRLDIAPIHFTGNYDRDNLLDHLERFTEENPNDVNQIAGSIDFSPLADLASNGVFPKGEDESFQACINLIKRVQKNFPKLYVIGVHGDLIENSGASIVQEIAYTLASGAEYLSRLSEAGLSVETIAPRIHFTMATGTNYFFEIAKIRATRWLWAKIVEAFDPTSKATGMFLHSITSGRNQSVYDPYVNMLRTTTEAMSAALGGTDSLTVQPFNNAFSKPDEFSRRVARNTQVILQEESYLDRVADPAAGSYYIEELTSMLADTSWKLFLEVDKAGSYSGAFKKGEIQDTIDLTVARRLENLAARKDNLVGTNQYPQFNERIKETLDRSIWQVEKRDNVKLGTRPLQPFRAARIFEEMRLRTEKFSDTAPRVFLFKFGNENMRRARAAFIGNFFGCAGFEILDNTGFKTIQEGIKENRRLNADICVICSSDEEYTEIAPTIYNELKEDSIVVVAGYPKNAVDDLKQVGIKHFIHMRSNLMEELEKFQRELGIMK